jgi:hypothetical protein
MDDWARGSGPAQKLRVVKVVHFRVPRQSTAVEHDIVSMTVTTAHTHTGTSRAILSWNGDGRNRTFAERVVGRLLQPSKEVEGMMAPYRGRCVRRVCVWAVWGGGARGS